MTPKKPDLEGIDNFFGETPLDTGKDSASEPDKEPQKKEPKKSSSPSKKKSSEAKQNPVQKQEQVIQAPQRERMEQMATRISEVYVQLIERMYHEKRLAGESVTKGQLISYALEQTYPDELKRQRENK